MSNAFYFDGPKAQAIIEALGLPLETGRADPLHLRLMTVTTRGVFSLRNTL